MKLKEILDDKLFELYNNNIPQEIKTRIEEELDIIIDEKIEYQYLIAYEIAKKVKSDNRIMIDRICGSSYIAYLLGITFVNPIEYCIVYEKGFKPITFDLEFAEDYFKTIFEYTKEVCKKYSITINNEEDLKGHNLYLNTYELCSVLENLETRTGKHRQDIDLKDEELYKYLIDENTTIFDESEMKIATSLFNQEFIINNVNCVANVISLERSTITDKLDIVNSIIYYPVYREAIYSFLIMAGLEKKLAYEIMNFIAKGKHRIKNYKETWEKYIFIMKEHGIEDEYINCCSKIQYLFSKAYSINRAIIYVWLTYYKMNYLKVYEDVI